jgi:ubiquinone/menaquinone biosynthesis C-methylase UbiE
MLDRANAAADVRLHEQIAASRGWELRSGMRVLDLGCGAGTVVEAFRSLGYDAYGCDFDVPNDPRLRRISLRPYGLMFDDETFDFACSSQVLEHVQDHDATFAELARVLKPGAPSLHMFPARWAPIEPHTLVPLASFFRPTAWLRLWAALGVRNQFQKSLPARDAAARNARFLGEETNYLRVSELALIARRHFRQVEFAERDWLCATSRPLVPGLSVIYRHFRGVVLALVR